MENNLMKKNNLKFINKNILKLLILILLNKTLLGKNKIIYKKNNIIFKKFFKNNVYIYKGNNFRNINVNYYYLGYRFGNFLLTRKPFKYINKNKINEKLIKR